MQGLAALGTLSIFLLAQYHRAQVVLDACFGCGLVIQVCSCAVLPR